MSRCEMCGYYWQEENENHPYCHYDGPYYWAPCEQDDNYEEPQDYYGDIDEEEDYV